MSHLPTREIKITDNEGKQPMSTVFGELVVGQRRDDVSVQFQYNISDADVVDPAGTLTGTGAVNHITNRASVESGTGVGTASLQTKDSVRYRPGHECVAMFTTHYTDGEINSFQHMGCFNGSDGFYFGYKNDLFGVFRLNGGVETFTAQTTWNEDLLDGTGDSLFNLDPTKYNLYKISFGWLGIAPIFFSVYAGYKLGWILCHVIDLINVQDIPHIENPSIPVTIESGRTSGTGADLQIQSSSIRAGVVGEVVEDNQSDRRFGAFRANLTVAASTITHVLSIKSKDLFQTKDNHIKVDVEILVSTNSTNKDLVFKAYVPPQITLSTPLVYADVDSDNSVVQSSSTVATVTELSDPVDIAIILRNSFRANTNIKGLSLYSGDELIFAVDAPAGGGGDISLQINWKENF